MRQHIGMHAVPRARVPTAHLEPMCWELDARYMRVSARATRILRRELDCQWHLESVRVDTHMHRYTHSVMEAPTPVVPRVPCLLHRVSPRDARA